MREENRIVHGLWIGELTRLELLAIHSFVAHGHEFHLWRYGETPETLPLSVRLRDANEIIPRKDVFRKREQDADSGLGVGSYATFSDLFRIKLLHEHGGIWVDTDIVCLRPFDFPEPYVFRGHRVGAVMNVIKCPPRSKLTAELITSDEQPHEDSTWLGYTRIFYEHIVRAGLEGFIRDDLMPPDSWETVKPLIEGSVQPDPSWYGVHLLNELWNELRRTGGFYKGSKIAGRIPDKNHPWPGTTLFQWYREHDLYHRDWTSVAAPTNLRNAPVARQPISPRFKDHQRFDAAITSMSLGGAERILHETVATLNEARIRSGLFLLHDVEPAYPLEQLTYCDVLRAARFSRADKLRRIVAENVASAAPALFIHLMRAADVEPLAQLGTAVIPVVHNSEPGWPDPATALNDTAAPLVVAVSDAIREQLIQCGCTKPIVVLRHEVQRPPPTPERAATDRLSIRRRYGISDGTLFIGMVGAFKAQKMYTRAVRVLAALQEFIPSRLLILGGWNHEWGSGRAAYAAVCRQAAELGVSADVILPGEDAAVEPYYAAFDVYLNTSLYEGLSVSMLESIAAGCPVVTAAAGGNAESISEKDRVVVDGSDLDAYVDAILEVVAQNDRTIPPRPPVPDLVPQLWTLVGAHGVPRPQTRGRVSTLVVTENLNIGGPQRSLTNLLKSWPRDEPVAVAVLDERANGPYTAELEDAGIPVMALKSESLTVRCRRTLHLLDQLGCTTLAFWNVPPTFKLICAKVLEVRSEIRIVDVSPGPMLFNELDDLGDFPRRVSFSIEKYFTRLDYFVAKHFTGVPQNLPASKVRVIPNGVPLPLAQARLDGSAIGTACRIAPAKRIEYLIEMFDILAQKPVNGASLTIAGGYDPAHHEYAKYISEKVVAAGLDNVTFRGPLQNVDEFLQGLSVFAMISDDQGCPNASLEAMAMGVPVVANGSGGTAEQIDHGVNGFLVDESSPRSMAVAIEALLRNQDLRLRLGAAARRKVETTFSMDAMVSGYVDVFGYDDHTVRSAAKRIITRTWEQVNENRNLLTT